MRTDVTRLDLRLRWRSTAAYAAGIAGYTFLIVVLYPTFRHDTDIDQLTTSNPTLSALVGATGSLTSPTGWMNANLYANVLPLVVLIMTLGYGAAAVAGQDEAGTLGSIASLPLTRDEVLGQKIVTLLVLSLPVPVASGALTLVGRGYGIDLPVGALAQTTALTAMMAFDLGLIALAIGAWTGRRGAALGVGVAVASASYVVSSLAPVVDGVQRLRYLSPLYWSVGHNQLHDGADVVGLALLAALGLALAVAARIGFGRLDIH